MSSSSLAANAYDGPWAESLDLGKTQTTVDENKNRTQQTRDIAGRTLKVYDATPNAFLRPNASGFYSAWTGAPNGTHYQNVLELTADDDTSTNSSATANQRDSYFFPGAGLVGGTVVRAVVLRFRWKHYDAANPTPTGGIVPMLRQSSVDTLGPASVKTNTDGWGDERWEMPVNPRTGAAWTLAEVNAATEFGFKNSGGNAKPFVTQAYLEIVTQPAASVTTTYQYDKLQRLTGVTDANGNVTSIGYDLAGRKTSMSDPDMESWTYGYDVAGSLNSQTDARPVTTTLTYDAIERLTGKTYSNGDPAVAFTYDAYPDTAYCNTQAAASAKGKLVRMTSGAGAADREGNCYDVRGRTEKTRRVIGGTSYDLSRTFDALNNVLNLTYPDGEVVHQTYDANNGALTGVCQWTSSCVSGSTYLSAATRTPWLAPATLTLGSGKTTTYGYDSRMRLASIVTPAVTGNSQSLALTYDNASNVKTVTDSAVTRAETVNYSYDQLNRLFYMKINITVATYAYNQIGNMTTKNEFSPSMLNGMTATLNYPATGQAHPHAVTSTTGTPSLTLTYDANGNLATQGTSTYAFDAENRMKSRTISGGQMTYTYDAQGTLIKRTNTATGAWTAYVGGMYEKNSDGSLVKYYAAYGRAIAMRQVPSGGGSGTLCYLLADHLGSATAITDTTGAVVSTQKYWPYGTPRLQTGTLATDKQFTAQQVEPGDSALGLYNYRARFYSSVLGRFVSADPTDGSGPNRYAYVKNNPLNRIDPSGYDCVSWRPNPKDCLDDVVAPIVDATKFVVDGALDTQEKAKVAILDRLPGAVHTAYRQYVHYTNTFVTRHLEGQFRAAFDYSSFGLVPHEDPTTIAGSSFGLAFDVRVLTGCRADICGGLAINGDAVLTIGHTIATIHSKQWIADNFDSWILTLNRELNRIGIYEDLGDDWIYAHAGGDYLNYLAHAHEVGCGFDATGCALNYSELPDDFKQILLKLLGDFSSPDAK